MSLTETSFVTVSHRGPMAFTERDADCTVVWLRGEQDIAAAAALSETLAWAIALDDADLVVDLSRVNFMGAATVGVIIRAREFLRPQSRSVVVRSPSTCARRVLDLCGLADLLDPRAVDVTRLTGPADALGAWVAVPATDRLDRRADASSPTPRRAKNPVRAGRLPAAEAVIVGRPPSGG